jgi:hypothetical protein
VGNEPDIFLIGQGFYNSGGPDTRHNEHRWAKPPAEYPQWIHQACARNEIQGVWWWLYSISKDHYVSLENMPELYEAVKDLNQ